MLGGDVAPVAGVEIERQRETIWVVTSSCTAKMSVSSRSKRSAHKCPLVEASISCAVILTRAPDLRTLPSRT